MQVRLFLIVLALAALAGCMPPRTKETVLEDTLLAYSQTVRWGNVEAALGFVDPEVAHAHPLSQLDLARWQQVQVTAYSDEPAVHTTDTEVHQVVEIGLVNKNTQAARSVIDRQVWHYDEKGNRWWLMSGLPDITAH